MIFLVALSQNPNGLFCQGGKKTTKTQ